MKLQNDNNVNSSLPSSSSKLPYSLLDPNPSLIDQYGSLNDNISLAASLKTYRNGTIADGISKLILVVESNNTLQFSISGTERDNLTNGTLTCLDQSKVNNLFSTATVTPQNTNNGKSVIAAVYTPPDSFNNQYTGSNKIINVNVSEPNNLASTVYKLPIQLYRPPVVLVHGVWTNSNDTWVTVNDFTKKLTDNGFNYIFADYKEYNSETFDPCDDKLFGNYGINSIRNAIHDILGRYHYFSIAASQVDIVAHSMGGLMARGFVQQPDYKGTHNFMKGSIHRLITIGTPHFGGPLSKFLYDHRDHWYCTDGITQARNCKVEPKKLRTIYADNFNSPIDKGAAEALIPGSVAYSHLYQTNVKSYAIAGSWKPNANDSHQSQQKHYQFITDPLDFPLGFDLDKDGFHNEQNDLVVSVKSQLGGLKNQIRQPESKEPPNESAVYPNTVHGSFLIKCDKEVFSETKSPYIQEDVIRLLKSSDNNKFADAIGVGSSS